MLVHRFWEGPRRNLSFVELASVASFARYCQWMWTYTCRTAFGNHVQMHDARDLLPFEEFRALLRAGAAIQHLKDVLALAAVERHGGYFVDLDVVLLSRGLPATRSGYVFQTEPCRRAGLALAKADIEFDSVPYARGFVNISKKID